MNADLRESASAFICGSFRAFHARRLFRLTSQIPRETETSSIILVTRITSLQFELKHNEPLIQCAAGRLPTLLRANPGSRANMEHGMVKAGWIFAVILMAGSAGSPISPAAKKENGKGDMTAGAPIREVLTESQPVFTHEERTRITNWFSNRRGGLPPGLAKRDHLPPGLEKHLQRNGTLPPGLQKKVQDLPDGLERQLRMLPTGYRRVVIAGNVILMNEKTALVYDIVRNVIP